MEISLPLKKFINEYKELINDNEFEELYNKTDRLLMGDYFVLTLLLNKAGINPLNYMTYVPAYYMEEFKELITLKIPEGIKEIRGEAFYNCLNLETVYLPSTLQLIEEFAFEGCKSLKNVYYNGTKMQFANVEIDFRNASIFNASIHCKDGDIEVD